MPEYSSGQNFDAQDSMPDEKLMETIRSCAELGVKAIQYTGGGEPLVHPKIKDALRLTHEVGMEIALVSNGLALDEELIDILATSTWVRISLDAFRRETYSLLRRVKQSCYDTVRTNIASLAKKKKHMVLGVGFVINADNYQEVYDAARMCKDLGADNFRISAAFTPAGLGYFDSFYPKAKELAEKTKADLETDTFTVFNLFNDRIGDLFSGKQQYDFCPMKELVPYIGADLNVYTCCVLAYNDNGFIGSIKDQTFSDLWNSEEKKLFYQTHSPLKLCQVPCMFENKNNFINYCIKKDPIHINYI